MMGWLIACIAAAILALSIWIRNIRAWRAIRRYIPESDYDETPYCGVDDRGHESDRV